MCLKGGSKHRDLSGLSEVACYHQLEKCYLALCDITKGRFPLHSELVFAFAKIIRNGKQEKIIRNGLTIDQFGDTIGHVTNIIDIMLHF